MKYKKRVLKKYLFEFENGINIDIPEHWVQTLSLTAPDDMLPRAIENKVKALVNNILIMEEGRIVNVDSLSNHPEKWFNLGDKRLSKFMKKLGRILAVFEDGEERDITNLLEEIEKTYNIFGITEEGTVHCKDEYKKFFGDKFL